MRAPTRDRSHRRPDRHRRVLDRMAALVASLLLTGGLVGLTPAVAVAAGTAPSASAGGVAAGAVAPAAPKVVRQRPCPDGSIFTCITLRLPRDHFGPPGGPTFDITFALLRASDGPPKGTFVTVTGGPGTSGISAADPYTEEFDPRIHEQDDIVFFDQRGIGLSEPLQCPNATLAFYGTPIVPTRSPAQALAYAGAAKTYAHDCVKETKVDPSELPYFSTAQAVEDLDAFRAWLGAAKIDLYGESYGTQFAQQYAAAHPDHLRSLIIDGPVDLTLTGNQYYAEDVHAFDSTLTMTLDTCATDPVCRRNVVGHDALAEYDSLAARLRGGSLGYSFVTAWGTVERRRFTLTDLEVAAAGQVYSTYDRMILDRAIAQASRGQLLPLARLTYINLGQDPETLKPVPDPFDSDAMYYAVECMDYDYRVGTPDQSAAAYLAAGAAAHVSSVRLGSVFYGDLPCAYWPVHPATAARPSYLTHTPFPVFVLASTTDPATPYAGALRIFSHLSNGYLIVEPGGPHVIFGRGNECEDEDVTAWLVDGTLPASRTKSCDYVGVDPYVGIPAGAVSARSSALSAMGGVDDEINNNGDYWNWDGTGHLRFGCLFGGWIGYSPYPDGYKASLHSCSFSRGLPLSGHATIDTTDGTFSMKVTAPGGTKLTYLDDADGNRSVSGRWFGRLVSLHD
ncbi:MAG TPA: alpha/beta hydrolase [Candidatus Binatia bacterium]|nr:alpha/beta hydrolase [Candidatus Binatia bacterium]